MPRGRVIGPDFWSDETIIGHTPFARLFYIGLWNFAYCDYGHLPDEPFSLKLKVLPADPVKGQELVDELLGSGKLARHELPDGSTYLLMPSFRKHQTTDARWKSRCPVCNSLKLTETQPSLSEPPKTQPTTSVKGKEGKEENSSSTKKRSAQRKPETPLPEDWTPKPAHVALARERGVDGRHEEAQFRAHAEANDRRQRDWDAAFRMWLGNAKPRQQQRLTPEERARRTLALAMDLKEIE